MRPDPYVRVAAVVADEQGRYLAIEHRRGAERFWTFPGGSLNVGESLSYALRRSVFTTTGLHVRILGIACVGEVSLEVGERRRVEVYFSATCVDAEKAPQAPAAWKGLDEIARLFSPVAVLAAVRAGGGGAYLANITDARLARPRLPHRGRS